jgi:hypothetical protein
MLGSQPLIDPHPRAKVELCFPPACVLVKLDRTSGGAIAGLEEGIIPIFPVERSFQISMKTGKKAVTKTIKRRQLPMTQAYSFTDYRAQGQTISHVLVDIASPPTDRLTAFNAYVALSRRSGRDTI